MKSIEKQIEKIKNKVIKLDIKKKRAVFKIESKINALKEEKYNLQAILDIERMKTNGK